MKWRRWRWWLLGIGAYMVFFVTALPAVYLVSWLQPRLSNIELLDVTGTLWSGHAEELRVQSVSLGSLDWQFDWRAPFTATLGYRFDLHDGDARLGGRVDTRISSLYLRDIQGQLRVNMLDHWLPLPPHSLDGELHLDLSQLILREGRLAAAAGSVDLDGASLSWPSNFTLGAFRMLLGTTNGGVSGQIMDTASPIQLRMDATLAPDGRYHIVGNLAARDRGDAATQKFLANLGSPDSTGHYPFDYNGQW
jgi:hypothetical protein